MASLWISSLVKYLISLFFHSISGTNLGGLSYAEKGNQGWKNEQKQRKNAVTWLKSWKVDKELTFCHFPPIWNLLCETGINRTKDIINKVKMSQGS